jgi:hypothetical protein
MTISILILQFHCVWNSSDFEEHLCVLLKSSPSYMMDDDISHRRSAAASSRPCRTPEISTIKVSGRIVTAPKLVGDKVVAAPVVTEDAAAAAEPAKGGAKGGNEPAKGAAPAAKPRCSRPYTPHYIQRNTITERKLFDSLKK